MSNTPATPGAGRPEMRTSTHRRPSVTTTEQMLDGAPGSTPLHRLLAAATRPGAVEELAGETAAHAAFVVAARQRPLPSDNPRGEPMSKMLLSKLLAAKAVVAIALLGGATGVAVAASATSGLPDTLPATASEHASPRGPGDATTATDDATDPAAATSDAADGEQADATDATGAADPGHATPSPSLEGLCKAFAAGATDNPGKAAENPAFTALITAAGGIDNVPAFCAQLQAQSAAADEPAPAEAGTTEDPAARPGNSADAPGHATDHGTQDTTDHGSPAHPNDHGSQAGAGDKGTDQH